MATSEALKRVLANVKRINPITKIGVPKMEGIYLSKLQLKTLGEQLINMSSGPDGVCFMIGIEKDGTKTVEAIPYLKGGEHENPSNLKIFNGNIFRINAGGLDEDSLKDLIFDANGHHKDWKVQHLTPEMTATSKEQITQGSQKTPPPFA